MSTTTWTTSADIPPNAWAALVADVTRLLGVVAAGGSTVTNTTGSTGPELGAERIAFAVTAPQSQPLVVTFTRAAGTGEAVTSAPHTTGLVLAAVHRAARHWGQLLTYATDADTTARSVARAIGEALFGAEDRALAGDPGMSPASQMWEIVTAAHGRVVTGTPPGTLAPTLLGALIGELSAELDGAAIAGDLL